MCSLRPTWIALVLAILGLVVNVLLWQRLSLTREQVARQMAESALQATEARSAAHQAQELARDIQSFIHESMPGWKKQYPGVETLNVAVMGCVVNGPGEAREADLGVASGNGKGQIFVKGEVIKTVPESQIVETLIEEAMQSQCLREDVASWFFADLGDACFFIARQPGDLGLQVVELHELGVDLRFQGFADGVLLADKLICLLLLHLTAQAFDSGLLGFELGGFFSGSGRVWSCEASQARRLVKNRAMDDWRRSRSITATLAMFDLPVRVIGSPGSGKTMMASLVEFKLVEAILRDQNSSGNRLLAAALNESGFTDDDVPLIAAVRLPMESEYRDFWELPYEDSIKTRLIASLIQARAVLGLVRNLTASRQRSASEITFHTREDAAAQLTSIGGDKTADWIFLAMGYDEQVLRQLAQTDLSEQAMRQRGAQAGTVTGLYTLSYSTTAAGLL